MGDSRLMPAGNHRALLTAVLAVFALLLAATPAQAARVSSTVIDDGWDDYCGEPYNVHYTAAGGERNDLQVSGTRGEHFPAPLTPGPICWQMTPDTLTLSDLTAPVTTSGPICRPIDGKGARCSSNMIWRVTIWTADLRDLVKVGSAAPIANVTTGPGDDAINTANGNPYDTIGCGLGNDGATADPGDAVGADCEKVTRVG